MVLFVSNIVGFEKNRVVEMLYNRCPQKREVKAQLNGGWIRWTQIWPAADCLTVR